MSERKREGAREREREREGGGGIEKNAMICAYLYVTLSSQIVNLSWPHIANDFHQAHAVCHVAVMKMHACARYGQ